MQRETVYFIALHLLLTGHHPTFLQIAEATSATEGDAMRRCGTLISRGFLRLAPDVIARRIRLVRLPGGEPIPDAIFDVAWLEGNAQDAEPAPIPTTNPTPSPLLTLFLTEDPR